MATKKITDLQLISSVTDGISVPTDNGIQTYRFTAAQMKAYILATNSITSGMITAANVTLAKLEAAIFSGMSVVTPAADDYIPIADTSDSNNNKKILISDLKLNTYRSVVTTDSVGANDQTMKMSGASFTSTLPTAVGVSGKKYKYIHMGTSLSQVYTIATTSSQTIGGIAGGSYKLVTFGEVLEVESDGANWMIVGRQSNTGISTPAAITVTGVSVNPTKGATPTVDRCYYSRNGKYGRVQYEYAQTTTGANGTGDYLYALPSGLTFDSTYVTFETSATAVNLYGNDYGVFTGVINATTIYTLNVIPYSATQFRLASAGTAVVAGSGILNFGAGAGLKFGGFVNAPMTDFQP